MITVADAIWISIGQVEDKLSSSMTIVVSLYLKFYQIFKSFELFVLFFRVYIQCSFQKHQKKHIYEQRTMCKSIIYCIFENSCAPSINQPYSRCGYGLNARWPPVIKEFLDPGLHDLEFLQQPKTTRSALSNSRHNEKEWENQKFINYYLKNQNHVNCKNKWIYI